jgi:predicted transcriptional regulator of viral defense system
VFSHQTALSLYDLSDVNPARIHMTVPKSFRRNTPIPPALILRKADLATSDSQDIFSVRATTPLRTIADLIAEAKMDRKLLKQALNEGLERGLVTLRQIERAHLLPDIRREITSLIREGVGAEY